MAWQTPKTNWGQPGQTVPAATDFNRIEGNTQYLKDEIDSRLPKSLATAANQFLVSSGASNWVVKTIAQVKELLGLGSAAYTESSAYAPSSHINVSASTSAKGHVQLTNSVSSTSTTTAATPNSVKQAYDKANAALPKTGGTMTGILTAQSNTSYTVRQVRNIILSTASADVNAMQNGDIWIKYRD